MIRRFQYASVILAALLLWGCKKDDAVISMDPTKVTMEIVETVTRTATEGTNTRFELGDKIAITSVGLVEDMNATEHTLVGDMQLEGGEYYFDWNTPALFYAHYPHTAISEDDLVRMRIDSDQSSEEKFNLNDFMTSTVVGDPRDGGNVRFRFNHRTVLVKVVWNGILDATGATLGGIQSEAVWQKSTNSISSEGGHISIRMWRHDESRNEYWALIPPQVVPAGTELVKLTDPVQEFTYTTTSDIRFNSGSIKTIILTQNMDGTVQVTFSDIDIENWSDDNNMTDGTVDVKR